MDFICSNVDAIFKILFSKHFSSGRAKIEKPWRRIRGLWEAAWAMGDLAIQTSAYSHSIKAPHLILHVCWFAYFQERKNLFNTQFRQRKKPNKPCTNNLWVYNSSQQLHKKSWPAIKQLSRCAAQLNQAPVSTFTHLDQWLSQAAEIPPASQCQLSTHRDLLFISLSFLLFLCH